MKSKMRVWLAALVALALAVVAIAGCTSESAEAQAPSADDDARANEVVFYLQVHIACQ